MRRKTKRAQQGLVAWLGQHQIMPVGMIAFLDKLLPGYRHSYHAFMVHAQSPAAWPVFTVEVEYDTALIHVYPERTPFHGGDCIEAQLWKTLLEVCIQGYCVASELLQATRDSYTSPSIVYPDVSRKLKVFMTRALDLDGRLGQPLHPLGGVLGHMVRTRAKNWRQGWNNQPAAQQAQDLLYPGRGRVSRNLLNSTRIHDRRAHLCGGQMSLKDVLVAWDPLAREQRFGPEYKVYERKRQSYLAKITRVALRTGLYTPYYTNASIAGVGRHRGRRYLYFTFGQASKLVQQLQITYPELRKTDDG